VRVDRALIVLLGALMLLGLARFGSVRYGLLIYYKDPRGLRCATLDVLDDAILELSVGHLS